MPKIIKNRIRILIADDHEIVRYGLKHTLGQHHDFEVIGEADSCIDTLSLTAKFHPDVILLDLSLSDGDSLDCIPLLKTHCPDCKILIITASADKKIHLNALRYGAVGILLKNDSMTLLCKAIRSIHVNNELWVGKGLTAEIWKQHKQLLEPIETQYASSSLLSSSTPASKLPTQSLTQSDLTARESQIACLSSQGLTATQIGAKLLISEKTVRNQLTFIYNKLNIKNQLELSISCSHCNNFINCNHEDCVTNNACQYRDNCPD